MNLAKEVGKTAREKGKTIALAESITGGLVGSLITDEPGASDYFLASLVAYNNESKTKLLGVKGSTLRDHGAVSAQVAKEMATGARMLAGSDIGAACTGIAGPGGGSEDKPVGLVYLAIDDGKKVRSEKRLFLGDRWAIKCQTTVRLLEMIRNSLKDIE